MTSPVEQYRERLRQATERMSALRSALAEERGRHRAPVAVVGLGCRLPPAVSDPEVFFDGLLAGVDGTSPAPPGRYGEAAAGLPPGGYLADVRGFDAAFFGISPREAAAMDPQQRLLLEVVWEALERAGLPPERLPAGRVGVFLGIGGGDYLPRVLASAPEMYALTGNGGAFASGRLAYSLGFRGPCLAVDTACSSSLVALHLAVQSLRRGESDVAVVAGVNLVVEADTTRLLLRSGALAPDGRCKTFDAAADGFARAEGAVAVVLERLDDADPGDAPVLAVIRGSAINQDGRSTGLTAPNVEAQQAMLAAALADAGVEPDSVGYVETHGTGTALGDPIEFDALKAVFGGRRSDLPCVLGAVKSNVGHLEAAAGLVGLLKAIGCLQRGVIPPNLHFERVSPHLSLTGTPFALPTAAVPFPASQGPRRAGVSAFGMSGTNAHVILEQAPRELARRGVRSNSQAPASDGDGSSHQASASPAGGSRHQASASPAGGPDERGPARSEPRECVREGGLLTLSARHPDALAALAETTADALDAGLDVWAAARTTALHRSHHRHRLALVLTPSGEEAPATLWAFARGEPTPDLEAGEGTRRDPPVFVCAGQGTAWPGMGRALLAVPAARAVLEAAAPVVAEHGGFDLIEAICADDAPLQRTEVAQPAIVAVSLAIAAALGIHGIQPAAVIGHSVGELTAAHLAGALSRADALRLACVRGRVMQPTAFRGSMVAVELGPVAAAEAIARDGARLEIAAFNGPRATVIAGDTPAVEALTRRLRTDGVRCRPLDVAHAFHTAQMDPILPAFAAALGPLAPADLRCALYSTVTGTSVAGAELGVAHWQAGIRRPVRLADAVLAAAADGHRLFLEIGPHPILGGALQVEDGRVVPTLRRDRPARPALLRAVGALYVEGAPVDLAALHPGRGAVAAVPTYPWQRRDHWIERHAAIQAPAQGERHAAIQAPAQGEAAGEAPRAVEVIESTGGFHERHAIERRVRAEIAAVLRLGPDEPIPARRGLFELGFDSLMSVELARRLSRVFARPFGPTLVFDHPTLGGLVDHLCDATRRSPVAQRRDTREPIAILGMACRFPGGANDPDAFWDLLRDGRIGVSDVPPDRWDRDAFHDPDPRAPGKMYATLAGFLQGVDIRAFDAECFNISPAEASSLDPQQRLLLELTFEALDDAGRPPDRLEGTRTGIYVGIATSDYGQQLGRRPLAEYEAFFATGCAMNTAAGRLAYVLGTRGPTLALDTACSSSLVAAHLAVESLRRGETDLALVAGTNLMLDPAIGVIYSRMGGLAPDGRCKAFDADADGMVRGEGVAVVVLARLSDALRARDRVRAVIRGSAVGHDGRSSGLTVPSGPAQQAVVREALADAGVEPAAIDYVETHGTGTSLGDPIEANALLAELGPGRGADRPLVLGSVKANVGHLEPAAGLAGLIKVVQAMRHRTIPAQPTFARLNPAIRPGDVPLVVPTAPRPWTGRRLAGLSSFGISGTNAHLILEAFDDVDAGARGELPARAPVSAPSEGGAGGEQTAHVLPISARRADALAALAAEWRVRLSDETAPVADLCAAAALRRAHLPHRLAVAGIDRAGLVAALDAWRAGDAEHRGWAAGQTDAPARLAFVFSGHGGHWVGMARRLLDEPLFASALRRCDAALARLSPGTSLIASLTADDADARWQSKAVLHPLMLGLQVSLAVVWHHWGVVPAAVMGHSSGELAAAVAVGSLSLDDAFRISLARSAIIERLGPGKMAVVGLSPEALAGPLAAWDGRVTIAVHNAPRQVLISGDCEAVDALARRLAADNVFVKDLPGADKAGHSHHFDPHLPDLKATLAGLSPGPGRIPFYSTVTAGLVDGATLDADYWAANLRQRVRFADTVAQMHRDGIDAFLEIGPHPLLLPSIAQIAPSSRQVASLVRNADDRVSLRAALGRLHVAGVEIDWQRIHPGGSPALPLPRHPWHRQRHWMPPARSSAGEGRHPLIQQEMELARGGERVCEARLDLERLDVPGPLEVQGCRAVAPALLLEFVRVALGDAGAPAEVDLGPALPFERRVELQLALGSAGAFELFARVDGDDWRAQGRGRAVAPAAVEHADALPALRARCHALDDGYRDRTRARGLHLPPALDVLDRVWRGEREALARLKPVGGTWSFAAATASGLHLLADQVFPADAFPVAGELFWPRAVAATAPLQAPPAWLHVALRGPAGDILGAAGELTLLDDEGRPVGGLRGVRLTPPDRHLARRIVAAQLGRWAHALEWETLPASDGGAALEPGTWLLLSPAGDTTAADPPDARAARRGQSGGTADGAAALATALIAQGHGALVSRADDPRPLTEQIRVARQSGPLRGVVDLRGLMPALSDMSPRTGAPGALSDMSHRTGATGAGLDLSDLSEQLLASASVAEEAAVALVELTRALVAEGVGRLVILTRGGQPVRPGEAPDPSAAIRWGIGRTIGLEHPDLQVRLVDLDPATLDVSAAAREVLALDGEDQVAWRGPRRAGARLVPTAVPMPAAPLRLDPGGTWLVTGGLGGVGLQLARWLAERGARHILLVGRQGLPAAPATPEARERVAAVQALRDEGLAVQVAAPATPEERERVAAVQALRDEGLAVQVAAVDVADEAAMRALLDGLPRPLRGVFHAAGVTRFEPLVQTSPEVVRSVLRAKVAGAQVLDRLTRECRLDAFVCFSSASATWGAAGLAVYGAANHSLDLLAHRRRAEGLPALTIAWGGWSGGGMTGSATRAYAAQMGLLSSPAQQLLEAMDACLQAGLTQLTLAAVDWQLFKAVLEARGERPLLRQITVAAAISGDGPLARLLAETAAAGRWPALLAAVARRAAEVLGVGDPDALDRQRGFFQMGMDSMMTVRLRRALEVDTGASLPATLALEQPTVLALARWLAREVLGIEPPGDPSPATPADPPDERSEAELEALLAAELEVTSDD